MPETKLSPQKIICFFAGFWLSALALRVIIFWGFLNGRLPALYFFHYPIHHFFFGLLILIATGLAYYYLTLPGRWLVTLAGVGAGLMFDEFLFWTRGVFDYWSFYNFSALLAGGIICLIAYAHAKGRTTHLYLPGENHSSKQMLLPFFISVIFLYSLFSLHKALAAKDINHRSVSGQIIQTAGRLKTLSVKFLR